MHLALVTGSQYVNRSGVTALEHVAANRALVAEWFARSDAGYEVEECEADRELPERLEERFAGSNEPLESLVLYFAGYALLRDERGPAVILDGSRFRAIPLARLLHLATYAAKEALLVLDTTLLPVVETEPATMVDALLGTAAPGLSVSVLASSDTVTRRSRFGPSRFTDLLLLAVDSLGADARSAVEVSAGAVYRAMEQERLSFGSIGSAGYVPAGKEFSMLRGQLAGKRTWAPSPPATSWPTSVAPPPPPASPPLPSFENQPLPPPPEPSRPSRAAPAPTASQSIQSAPPPEPSRSRSAPPGPAPLDQRARLERALAQLDSRRGVVDAIDELEQIADELQAEPARRAETLIHAAAAASSLLRDPKRAVGLSLRALAADPTAWRAFDLAEGDLDRLKDWGALAELCEQALPHATDPERRARIAIRLAELRERNLSDEPSAMAALEQVLAAAPDNAAAHERLGELLSRRNLTADSARHFRAAIRAAPNRTTSYLGLFRALQRSRAWDAMWHAACALVVLEAAPPEVRTAAEAYRVDGLLAPRSEIDDTTFDRFLRARSGDEPFDELMKALAPAAARARTRLGQKNSAHELRDAEPHEPQTSTATLARTLLWTARFLSVSPPALYLADRTDRIMTCVPIEQPTSVVSRSLGRGLDLPELVFLWARHLVAYRPEYELARLFETTADIGTLVEAALAMVDGPRAVKQLDDNTRRLARLLDKTAEPQDLESLNRAAAGLGSGDLRDRARRWLGAAERTAARAGLICTGDVRVAVRSLKRFPLPGALALDALARDLCGFSASEEHASLRARLGVEIPFERALAG